MEKEWLYGKTLAELTGIVSDLGLPRYSAGQFAQWLYNKQATEIDRMSDISKKARKLLSDRYVAGIIDFSEVQESEDGTKKYLFPTLQQQFIESVYIPDRQRATLCVSSQAGCRMGCRFCMTARQGFQHHLTPGEILNQIRSIPEYDKLTNAVYMGMGEPLDNAENVIKSIEILTAEWGYGWSPGRITLSTIGVMPSLDEFLSRTKVHLAVSLHTPFEDERATLMPAQKAHPLREVLARIKAHDFSRQRRVSFEYILFKGLNDTEKHAAQLAGMLKGLPCRVNLIRFHPVPGSALTGSDEPAVQRFKESMNRKGILTTVRASRGEDIFAACGMLSTAKKLSMPGD